MPPIVLAVAALALVAGALASGSGAPKAPQGGGGGGGGGTAPSPGNGGTPPPGVDFSGCLDASLPPDLRAQVLALLQKAQAGQATADQLNAAASLADMMQAPKAAACLRQFAKSTSPAGGASGFMPTLGTSLVGPAARPAMMRPMAVSVLAPSAGIVSAGFGKGGASDIVPAGGATHCLSTDPNSCLESLQSPMGVDQCVAGIPEPARTSVANLIRAGLAGKIPSQQAKNAGDSLRGLGFTTAAQCLYSLQAFLADKEATDAAQAAQTAALKAAGF